MVAAAQSIHADVGIDPELARTVGDVARPQRSPVLNSRLEHLPGKGPGLIRAVLWVSDYMRRGVGAISDYQRAYGPVPRIAYRNGSAVMVCDPDLILRIARNTDQAWSAALAWTAFFEGLDVRDAVAMLDFDPHKDARKRLQPAFTPSALDGYLSVAAPLFEEAVSEWMAEGKVSFKAAVRSLLASVSSRIFLGHDASGPMLDRALAETWSAPYAIARSELLSPTWRRGLRGHRRMSETLRAMVPVRRASGGLDLFSRLCAPAADGSEVDEDLIVRSFIGVMFGAFDTTSAGLASMAYLLARHPEWQERLRAEAIAAGPEQLDAQRAHRLDATDRCWKETLRLYPVVGGLPRCALRDVDLGGYRIPAGALVFAMLGPAQRDGGAWTRPEEFDPDRFAEGRAEDKKKPGQFMPFGAGPHACIGSMLTTLEAKAFWHAVLPRMRFRLARDYEARHTYTPMGAVSGDVKLVVERA